MPTKSDIEQAILIFEQAHQVMEEVVGDGSEASIGFTRSQLDTINRATITAARLIRRKASARNGMKALPLPDPLTEQRNKIVRFYKEMAKLKPEELIPNPDDESESRTNPLKTEIAVRPVYAWSKGKGSELLTLWGILAAKMEIEVGA